MPIMEILFNYKRQGCQDEKDKFLTVIKLTLGAKKKIIKPNKKTTNKTKSE